MVPDTPPPPALVNNLPIRASSAITPQVHQNHGPGPHFLLLPAELRLICYEYAFSYPPTSLEPSPLKSSSDRLQLLLTCKQMYDEACLIAYSQVEFRMSLWNLGDLPRKLRALRENQIKSIRNLTLTISIGQRVVYRALRKEFKLRTLSDLEPETYPDGLTRLRLDTLSFDCLDLGVAPLTWFKLFNLPRAMLADLQYEFEHIRLEYMYTRMMSDWLDALGVRKVVAFNYAGEDKFRCLFAQHPANWRIQKREEEGRTIDELTRIEDV